MKIGLHCLLSSFILINLTQISGADQEVPKEQRTQLEQSVETIIDPYLRKAALEMVRLVVLHSQSRSNDARGKDIQDIYRASWAVYANFLGMRETHSDREVGKSKEIIATLYLMAVKHTAWIDEQKNLSRELLLARTDVERKLAFFRGKK